MSTLYIDRKNLRLDCDAEALVIYENGARVGTVPLAPLRRVIIRGGVTVDTALFGKLGAHGIGVILLSGRKAEPTLFMPRPHNDATRRLAQYAVASNPVWQLDIARAIIARKFQAQIAFLRLKLGDRLDARYEVTQVLQALDQMQRRIDAHVTLGALRGLEGAAASQYFSGYACLAPPSVHFHGRNRRPPRDPLNATLSLAYTLLYAEAVLVAHALGLDPWIGFLHAPAFSRASLAADLMEDQRPAVDAWAITLFNKQDLRADHFTTTQEGCFLGKAGREHFYHAWEPLAEQLRKRLETTGQALLTQIESLAPKLPEVDLEANSE